MPMNPGALEAAIKGVVFAELQAQFLGDVPPENKPAITKQHDKLATAVSKAAEQIVIHIQTMAQIMPTAMASTVVAGVTGPCPLGAPTSVTGSGTGPVQGPPGSIM